MTTLVPIGMQVLLDEKNIAQTIDRLARDIAANMPDDFVCLALMDGAFVFAADLMRALFERGVNPSFESLNLSSYGDAQVSSGVVTIYFPEDRRFDGQTVLIVDDVLDTGLTLSTAVRLIKDRGAAHVKTCVFAQKPSTARDVVSADYVGWDAPDRFLVGYGLDDAGKFRGQPFVGAL